MKLIFATQNKYKQREVEHLIGDVVEILSLSDFKFDQELPETHFTLEENAAEKAEFIFQQFGQSCFAEDTGLEVNALNGAPGVFSARYAGESKSAIDNVQLLLRNLKEEENRSACFRTVICLVMEGKEYFFEGRVEGSIAGNIRGEKGFGYDPVFIPLGSEQTYAEMEFEQKNSVSHRKKAFDLLKKFLEEKILKPNGG